MKTNLNATLVCVNLPEIADALVSLHVVNDTTTAAKVAEQIVADCKAVAEAAAEKGAEVGAFIDIARECRGIDNADGEPEIIHVRYKVVNTELDKTPTA